VQIQSQCDSTTSIAAQQPRSTKSAPNVGRDRRSFLPVSDATTEWSQATAERAPQRARLRKPSPSIVAQQPRSSESTPQRGSRPPLIPPASDAHCGVRGLAHVPSESTEPSQLPLSEPCRWLNLRLPSPRMLPHVRFAAVSAPQRGAQPPIISLIPPGCNAHYGCPRPGPPHDPFDRAQKSAAATSRRIFPR
jgi:hypothetical protein